jgi:endonuclease YncB( thermonuclease family)
MPFVLLIALLCACVLSPASAAEITGKTTHIVDGDTFDIESPSGQVRIRICGIDSPERGHKGYTDATEELRAPHRWA